MAEIKVERTPFKEAIEFLKNKTALPSGAYTEVLREMHNKAFVIANVTKADVVTDVHELVTKALRDGIPFKQFEKEFRDTIRGRWLPTTKTGEDNTGWRARLVYETNTRAAYAAGRYEQHMRMTKTHPYWRYRHGRSKVPRPEHLAWDGLVLRYDNPWWDTHYPMNDYGCQCYVEALDQVGLEELGKTGPDATPPNEMVMVKFGDREVLTPKGVSPAWAYAPGAGGNQGLLRSLAQAEPTVAVKAWEQIKEHALKEEIKAFQNAASKMISLLGKNLSKKEFGKAAYGMMGRRAWVVGFMDSTTLEKVKGVGLLPSSAALEVVDEDVFHAMRDAHKLWGVDITEKAYLNLPNILANPQTVILFDKQNGTLLYVFDPNVTDPKKGKMAGVFAVKVGEYEAPTRLKKKSRTLCKVRSAELIPLSDLKKQGSYAPIQGAL